MLIEPRNEMLVTERAAAICSELSRNAIWIGDDLFDECLVERAGLTASATPLCPDRVGAKRLEEQADQRHAYAFFFNSPIIASVMRTLIGEGAVSRRNRVQERTDQNGGTTPITLFHIDSEAPRYKVFLYLQDVGEEDGPFEFLRGSHCGAWRQRYLREVRLALAENASDEGLEELDYSGCLRSQEELARALERHQLLRATGPRGTCIFFDTRGFHRASPMRSGSRMILSMDWMGPDLVI